MSVVPFDTLKFVGKLEAGGFTHQQVKAAAEAFAEATSLELATKTDMTSSLLATRQELESRIRESELRLEAKIEATKADLLKTLIGAVAFNSAVVLGAMFGLAKLLGH